MNNGKRIVALILYILTGYLFPAAAQTAKSKVGATSAAYAANCAPLYQNPYRALPLGAIRPEGWVTEMLVRQRDALRISQFPVISR